MAVTTLQNYAQKNKDEVRLYDRLTETEKGEKETKNELDRLFEDVKDYHRSDHYYKMMKFCSKFKTLGPFNAMMVQIQRPECRYILTANQWKRKYKRGIKENARPVVILSYMPVSYLYDIMDTYPIDNPPKSTDQQILEEIKNQYNTKQEVSEEDYNTLLENLAVLGIAHDNMRVGGQQAAQIEPLVRDREITVSVNKSSTVKYSAHYLISVNETMEIGAKYASVMHELGHFFCHHLPAPPTYSPKEKPWWKIRALPENVREFEAESVAWLLCERLNINNPSEKYLAGYVDDHADIPQGISISAIFKAHNEIWKLLFERQNAKDNFLYDKDKNFKTLVDDVRAEQKPNAKRRMPVQQDLFSN